MPCKRISQQKYFQTNKKKLEKQALDIEERDKESEGLKLPKKVKKKK